MAPPIAVLRWLADENFNNDILRSLLRANRNIDIVRAQDVGLTGAADDSVLAWAAQESRLLLTHDISTVTAHAYRRVMKGDRMTGVFEISRRVRIRSAVEDVLLLTECSNPEE